jgi:Holliday junction DNA helicase RuvA
VTVDVNGVGYEVLIPLSSFDKLPSTGNSVKLLTHLAVREDAHVLYGFMTSSEREMFRLLINNVSGIGPKIALNVLSGMNVTALRGGRWRMETSRRCRRFPGLEKRLRSESSSS